MLQPYINKSIYNVDNFFKSDRWLYRLKINDYQVVTIFWNVFLIIIPFVIALIMIKLWKRSYFSALGAKLLAGLLFFMWLLFVPNTAYIMGEVRHLLDYCPRDSQFRVCEEHAWMPLFFFLYAAIGWASFVYLLAQMKALITAVFNRWVGYAFLVITIPLVALGFLIGLINRWNSWEFFIYPKLLYSTISTYWTEPVSFTNWLAFSILLYSLYAFGSWLFKERFRLY